MILQALHNYYDRLESTGSVPLVGFSMENVGFALEIDDDGDLVQVLDLREREGSFLRPKLLQIPYTNKVNVRSSNVEANFLVDKAAYMLGRDLKTKAAKLLETYAAFRNLFEQVTYGLKDRGVDAIRQFYRRWNPSHAAEVLRYWEEIGGGNAGFIAFKLSGDLEYVHERRAVRTAWTEFFTAKQSNPTAQCLVCGLTDGIQPLHAQFKGLRGGQSSGKSLVSINWNAAESYGKNGALNSPVSVTAEFKSATALKYLVRTANHKIYLGETATVFWTERDSPVEGFFGMVLDPGDSGADDKELAVYLEAIRQAKIPTGLDPDISFYILGLAPNAARLSVRFWHVSTVGEISRVLGRHFSDLEIVRSFDSDPPYPGLWRLLKATCNSKSDDGPSPLLGGAVMQAILKGTLYPQKLLSAVIGRIRAEQANKDKTGRPIQNVNYIRAAIIKAVLTRKHRITGQGTEIPMSLDKENKNIAYLLGRLFAVLEMLQKKAISGANATIKDRFYGSASATPRVVFPRLIALAHHHLGKVEHSRFYDRQIEEILGEVNDFPAHLNLDQQGRFAIGYYQQRQDFYRKTSEHTETKES